MSGSTRIQKGIDELIDDLPHLDFDFDSAEIFGRIRAQSILNGKIVAAQDLMIAAVALRHDFTLVTHNTKDFASIPDLRVEDRLV